MITNRQLGKVYTILFLKYKSDLKKLGVPTYNFDNTTLHKWFDLYLNKIEEGN